MEEKNKQKIRDSVQQFFIERNENTIKETISYCIDLGMTEDEARHTVIQVTKNLPSYLLPLKTKNNAEKEYLFPIKMILCDGIR